MARRRRTSRLNKGWMYTSDVTVLSGTNVPMSTSDICVFGDLGVDEGVIQRERSDYAMRRLLLWGVCTVSAGGAFITQALFDLRIRIGTIRLDDLDGADTAAMSPPDYAANLFGRIFWERNVAIWKSQGLPYSADTLVTDGGPATFVAFPQPPYQFSLDIQLNARLTEEQNLVLMLGTDQDDDDISYGCFWNAKMLCTKVS